MYNIHKDYNMLIVIYISGAATVRKTHLMQISQVNSVYTVGPGSSDPFYIVTYYIKWVTISWTYSTKKYDTVCTMNRCIVY